MNGSTSSRPPDLRQPPGSGGGGKPPRAGDERPREARNGHASGGATTGRPAPPSRRLSGSAAVEHAKSHLMEFTGQPCEGVSSLSRTREGWRVVLEVLELERIPRTTDILASYMVELDERGELMGYERIQRYYRNDVGGDQ